MLSKIKRLKDEPGQAMLLFALAFVVLCGFAAFAVDIGLVSAEKADLQNAADAAALAGAQDLPNTATARSTAFTYAELNGVETANTSVTPSYNGNSNLIEVVCTQTVEYTFARVLGFTSTQVSARAVAEKQSQWNGEGLPFINLDFDYTDDDEIVSWVGVAPGDKGTLTDFYTKGVDPNIYFELDYTDGLTTKKGFANGDKGLDGSKLKDGLQAILTEDNIGKHLYLFSLRADLIGGEFTVLRNGMPKTVSLDGKGNKKLKNGDVIAPDQLVLIECVFEGIDGNWNNLHHIMLEYTGNVFDLGNVTEGMDDLPDFPTEYLSSEASSSELVE